jgi:hypothetical protein
MTKRRVIALECRQEEEIFIVTAIISGQIPSKMINRYHLMEQLIIRILEEEKN